MQAGRVDLRGDRHRRGREILHLLQPESGLLGLQREPGHVLRPRAGVRTDEIRHQLELRFSEPGLDRIKTLLETAKKRKRRFAHDPQHLVRCVLGRNLEPARHMMRHEFVDVPVISLAHIGRRPPVQQQIVPESTRHEGVFHPGMARTAR